MRNHRKAWMRLLYRLAQAHLELLSEQGTEQDLAEQGKKLLGDISEAWAKQVDALRQEIAERERRLRNREKALEEARNMKLVDTSENAPTGAWAADLARRYERWVGKLEEHYDNWVSEKPSFWKNLAATAALSAAQAISPRIARASART